MMLAPGVLLALLFYYLPMGGLFIAFQHFIPAKGFFGRQEWVGLDNFVYIFQDPYAFRALQNTIAIAFFKIVTGIVVPVFFAILLNEIVSPVLKKGIQTAIYLPYFISWVILGGVLVDLLSPSSGVVNSALRILGAKPIFFLGDNAWFRPTLIVSNVWKEFGFGTVVYLASITSIDPGLYESAKIDGANRWQQVWNVTLPGMRMIIVLMTVLALGNVLNAGFDQVFNLYSPQVYQSGDILDTFVYRLGLQQSQYGPATAVGLFKSLVSLLFISVSYFVAYRCFDYRIF
jgi:putative aldouronate transport system permease protein